MLRDLVLVTCLLYCLWLSFRHPMAGVLAWTWLTLMQPHREVYGFFSSTLRLNFTVAFVTILAWFFSKERKLPPVDGSIVAVGVFLFWMALASFFAVNPFLSWYLWDAKWKMIALALLISATATNKNRIHALIWVMALSLMYYGVKGGFLTILTGGTKKISGPNGTLIGDNNHLAVALLMMLPLLNYLRLHTANRLLRLGLIFGFTACFLSVVGSYSRGAFVAMGSLGIVWWLRSRNKLLYLIFGAVLIMPIYYFMPPAYYERLGTLNDADADASFQGRLQAWRVAYSYARDHFPLGAGFDGPQEPSVFFQYIPGSETHAAHSIYFQVLGDTGFPGLAIYLVILSLAFLNCYRIRKATRKRPELEWAYDLATMIQLSLVAFCVGGAALSLAYYDIAFIWAAGVLPALWKLVKQQTASHAQKAPKIGVPAFASLANEHEVYASTYPTPGKL